MKKLTMILLAVASFMLGVVVDDVMVSRNARTRADMIAEYYDMTGYKAPLLVGDVEIWTRHSGAREQIKHRLRYVDPGLFDLIGWGEFMDLGETQNERIRAVRESERKSQ